jgi:hypothetical protein
VSNCPRAAAGAARSDAISARASDEPFSSMRRTRESISSAALSLLLSNCVGVDCNQTVEGRLVAAKMRSAGCVEAASIDAPNPDDLYSPS